MFQAMLSLRRLASTVGAGALVGALAGFSGAPGALPEKKTPAVCKPLTTREAAGILGTDVTKGKEKKATLPRPGAKSSQCEWASKAEGVGGNEGKPFKLQVEANTGKTVGHDYEKAKARVDFKGLVTVPDLGKDAFYDDSPFNAVHVFVAENKVLSTGVTNYDTSKADLPKPPEQMSIDAAKIAVPRLTK